VLAAVREILQAHDLTLFEVDGVYIVGHRTVTNIGHEPATVLIRFRDAQTDAVISGARVSGLPESAEQTSNRRERSLAINLPPGDYPIVVTAPGYKPLEASINAASEETRTATLRLSPQETPLTEVVVAASRYELLRDAIDNPIGLDRKSIMQTPDTGDDPIRAVQRLPGTTSGASAQPHLRGGSTRETGIVLDGHRLLNPFHVRDYQSLFSAIDVRAINGIEVYTGDFPVRYGDLTGGLVLVDTLTPDAGIRNEFGLSVFNASILSAGQIADGDVDYVVSIRRGNLDLILNEEIGEPAYYDVYSKVSYQPSLDTTLSANLMIVKDSVIIIPAADIDEREETTNDTRNSQFWLSWEQQWSDALSSLTILSASDSISGRHALVSDPEKINGSLSDERTITIFRLNQDWKLDLNDRHLLGWGAEFQQVDADYNYRSAVDYYGMYQDLPGRANSQSRALNSNVDGDAMAFYASDRWMVNRRLIADLGLRWDKQSYTDTDDNGQFSPRVSLLYRLNPKTNLHLSWGRYYQSQGAHELQVEDGVTNFFPAQRFDQSIFGVDYQLDAHYSLRAELYVKTSKSIRPHFENLFD
ncbi:MAG: TonB-dependent receptor, partial [Woeseia sp.]